MSFTQFGLDDKLLRALEKAGFSEPTEIQKQAIPLVLEGKDLMASAQTGTGKTAAFVLPALQRLIIENGENGGKKGRAPRVLVLTPTRELAMQVSENIRLFSSLTRIFSGNVVGGMPYQPQIRLLKQGSDIIVATPGRLMDHMRSGVADLSQVEMLVLDEADRMLDMGFIDDVTEIASKTPTTRQTVLFSATLDNQILQFTKGLLRDPARVEIASRTVKHESIEQRLHQADDFSHKRELLKHCLLNEGVEQAVVFTATKRGAEDLAEQLSADGEAAAALHGDMRQNARKRTVEHMKRGRVKVLVATDVAARGLDIRGVSHVFNFDLPLVAEDYVHRIGRTGRGGAKGTAISFAGPEDWSKLKNIERYTGQKIPRSVIPGLEPKKAERPERSRFDDRKPRSFKPRSRPQGGEKREFGGKREFGEKREFGGKREFGEKREFTGKREFGEKREFTGKREFGEKREFTGKREFGEKRDFGAKREFGEKREFAPKREFGEKREFNGNREGREQREFRGSREFREPRRSSEFRSFSDQPRKKEGTPKARFRNNGGRAEPYEA